MEKFWMVLGNNAPKAKHSTREKADREAERLARQHPDTTFFVLEAVACVKIADVVWSIPANVGGRGTISF